MLEEARLELGLSLEEVAVIEKEYAPAMIKQYMEIVESVLIDGKISDIERRFLDNKAKEYGLDSWEIKQVEESYM